jgi:hypothetical protein
MPVSQISTFRDHLLCHCLRRIRIRPSSSQIGFPQSPATTQINQLSYTLYFLN